MGLFRSCVHLDREAGRPGTLFAYRRVRFGEDSSDFRGFAKVLMDDGKHAFRVIEVDSSLLEAIWEGGLGGGA